MKDIMMNTPYDKSPSKLEIYADYSTRFPDRLAILGKLSESNLDNIKQVCESQFDYCYIIQHPFVNRYDIFFESEEDATLAKIVVGGDYQLKEFDK
tara:strand:- start:5022 stop:5309 length:288 start_codon:yes stop_codon:yes gene_type:complete